MYFRFLFFSGEMDHYMPEIHYHDRKALLSVDCHPVCANGKYRMVTSSVQNEIRIWEFEFEAVNLDVAPLAVHFIANLTGHNSAINQVKFCQNPDFNLLASGDCHGRLAIWQLSDAPVTAPPPDNFPPNKENWLRVKVLNHESDVNAICWSPCGVYIASVSNDNSLLVHEALTGKRLFSVGHLRHNPNGISWDPSGKYIVTMSTDRKMDLVDANKGTRLRSFGSAVIPSLSIGDVLLEEKSYKLFHDDQLVCFQRGVAFSPCGQLIVAPCARLEVGASDIYATLVFKRWELEKERPAAILPYDKATFIVRFCPVVFDLKESSLNYSGLPYRLIWLALTKDSVIFYDSQHPHPIGLVENITLNNLTEATWTQDGKIVIISSMEGYCSFLKLKLDQWGVLAVNYESRREQCPASPQLIQVKKKRKERKEVKEEEGLASPAPVPASIAKLTPLKPAATPATPTRGILKFVKKTEDTATPNNPPINRSSDEPEKTAKPKKRMNVITIS